jgi:hypothetical protein
MIDVNVIGSAVYVLIDDSNKEAIVIGTGNGYKGLVDEMYCISTKVKHEGFNVTSVKAYPLPEESILRLQTIDNKISECLDSGYNVRNSTRKRSSMTYKIICKSMKLGGMISRQNIFIVIEKSIKYNGKVRGVFEMNDEANSFISYLKASNDDMLRPLCANNELTKAWILEEERRKSEYLIPNKKSVALAMQGSGVEARKISSARAYVLHHIKILLSEHPSNVI